MTALEILEMKYREQEDYLNKCLTARPDLGFGAMQKQVQSAFDAWQAELKKTEEGK